MELKQKEKFYAYLADKFDSMNYPPVIGNKPLKRENIMNGWRQRVKEILRGAVDHPGLYVHIPYCQTKCFYCKFRTRVSNSPAEIDAYVKCLKQEIEEFTPIFKKVRFETVYFGGGTPTILSAHQLDDLCGHLENRFSLGCVRQRLIESTPAALSPDKIKIMKKYGFNRLTIGVQTTDERLLKSINRMRQTKESVRRAFQAARAQSMPDINIDLMAGLPGQSLLSLLADVDFVLELRPSAIHIFCYQEEDQVIFCKMGKRVKGRDQALVDRMMKEADFKIKRYGYRSQYRNEPYLLRPEACNLQFQFRHFYNSSLLGIGAGAQSYINGHYVYGNAILEDYLKFRMNNISPPCLNGSYLSPKDCRINYVLNNIRPGIERRNYLNLFGREFDRDFKRELESLRRLGRLRDDGEKCVLVVANDLEFRTYTKFFFDSKIIKKYERIVAEKCKNLS